MTAPSDAPRATRADAAARALYLQAQDQLSVATTARLHRVRTAALDEATPSRRGWMLPLTAGFAALFALAVGIQLGGPSAPDIPSTDTDAGPLVAVDEAVFDDGTTDAFVAYDESPDFYLWLAANEATLLAME